MNRACSSQNDTFIMTRPAVSTASALIKEGLGADGKTLYVEFGGLRCGFEFTDNKGRRGRIHVAPDMCYCIQSRSGKGWNKRFTVRYLKDGRLLSQDEARQISGVLCGELVSFLKNAAEQTPCRGWGGTVHPWGRWGTA